MLVINSFLYVTYKKFIHMEVLAWVEYAIIDNIIMWKDFSKSADSLENVNAEHHNLDCKLV